MIWQLLDSVGHILNEPFIRKGEPRWYHRIKFIPTRLLAFVCQRYDDWLEGPPICQFTGSLADQVFQCRSCGCYPEDDCPYEAKRTV